MSPEPAPTESSRHKCLIYDGHPSEQLPVIAPLLIDGINDRWRCLYLGDPDTLQMIDSALGDRGIDTGGEVRRGALVLSADRSHLAGGTFDPQSLVQTLRGLIDDAVSDGFLGLCATGDMAWELGSEKNFTHLVEYESRLEQVFHEKPLRGICQYRRDLLPHHAVRHALLTHRSVYVGDTLNQDNLFYVPPDILLEGDESERDRQGEWMCRQIVRVLKAEAARDQALRDLRAANHDLERRVAERTEELEVANRQLEAFSYSVSHDLRAPLRAIGGFREVLSTDFGEVLGAEGRSHLARIRNAVERMQALIEGMLTLSRAGKAPLARVAVDLTALAEEVSHELRAGSPERAADFVIQLGLTAPGDRTLLRAVLANLLGNAWKFSGRRGKARIEFGRSGQEAGHQVFFVRDNGAGFDLAHAQRLFGTFQRFHREDEFPGTGVGLATVQRIITRHGGRVWAESEPERGATFFFTLPDAPPG